MNKLINFTHRLISNPFGIVICSLLLFLVFILLVCIPFVTLEAMIEAADYIGYQLLFGAGALFIITMAIGVFTWLSNTLRLLIEQVLKGTKNSSSFNINVWQTWGTLMRWMLVFTIIYSVIFCIQMAIVIMETNTPWNFTSLVAYSLGLDVSEFMSRTLALFIMLYLSVSMACAIYIKLLITDEEKNDPTALRSILKYKLMTLVFVPVGAVFVILAPYVTALINNSPEEVMSPVANPIGAAIIIMGITGILLFTPHNASSGFYLFKNKGIGTAGRYLFLWGMGVLAFIVLWSQGNHLYDTSPEQANHQEIIIGE